MSQAGLAHQQVSITLRTKSKFLAVTYKALPDLASAYLSNLVLFFLADYVSATVFLSFSRKHYFCTDSWPFLCIEILPLAFCVTGFFSLLMSQILLHLVEDVFFGLILICFPSLSYFSFIAPCICLL